MTLYWFYGREAVGNSQPRSRSPTLSGKVPDWAVYAAPVVMVAAVALVTAYLAFGRHLAVKLIGVAVVVVVLATPGLAVGYANGLVSAVGTAGSAATTPADEAAIAAADNEVDRPIPNRPMNILLIGSDKSTVPGDPGRSDTQMLVRLDPETKSISMLSLPRDLRVDIPDHGYDKMNAAYSYGGPALVIKTFKQLTGLPINGWIEINFAGFWHVVNILGGVYLPVDRKYFVPASADYKSIDLDAGLPARPRQAGAQLRALPPRPEGRLHAHAAPAAVPQGAAAPVRTLERRLDQGPQAHQGHHRRDQVRASARSRRSSRWSSSPSRSTRRRSTRRTSRALTLMINGIAYVTATDAQIADVVHQFTNPTQAPVKTDWNQDRQEDVRRAGVQRQRHRRPCDHSRLAAERAGLQRRGGGRRVRLPRQGHGGVRAREPAVSGRCDRRDDVAVRRAYRRAHSGDQRRHQRVRRLLLRRHSSQIPQTVVQQQQTLAKNQKVDWTTWQQYDKQTPLKLEAPTAWSSGFTYDEWRNYSIETTDGKHAAASVAVVQTPQYGYWSIQAMRWSDPPAIEHPNSTQTVDGRKFMLFYQGDHLHMVAWKEHGTLYWVLNTLDNQLSNDLMLGLAASCEPVK